MGACLDKPGSDGMYHRSEEDENMRQDLLSLKAELTTLIDQTKEERKRFIHEKQGELGILKTELDRVVDEKKHIEKCKNDLETEFMELKLQLQTVSDKRKVEKKQFIEENKRLKQELSDLKNATKNEKKKQEVETKTYDSGVVILNVGGTTFKTSMETLKSDDSELLNMVNQVMDDSEYVPKDCERVVFIDRSPTFFEYVLDWLRAMRAGLESEFVFPRGKSEMRRLRQEVVFYGIGTLLSRIDDTSTLENESFEERSLPSSHQTGDGVIPMGDPKENTLTLLSSGVRSFPGMNLSGLTMPKDGKDFDLRYCDMQHAVLDGCNLERADLSRANLTMANLKEAKLLRATLSFANCSGANFQDASFDETTCIGTNFKGARLSTVGYSSLQGTFHNADFTDADLSGVTLYLYDNGHLKGACFRNAIMKNVKTHTPNYGIYQRTSDVSLADISFAGANFSEGEYTILRLNGADLTGADFSGMKTKFPTRHSHYSEKELLQMENELYVSFVGSNLSKASFRGAKLHMVDFTKANLHSADFSDADFTAEKEHYRREHLRRTCMTSADLTNANFRGANLAGIALHHATVTNADFRGASGVDINNLRERGAKVE